MKAILDTHVFLWWVLDNPKLSRTAQDFIVNPRQQHLSQCCERLGNGNKMEYW